MDFWQTLFSPEYLFSLIFVSVLHPLILVAVDKLNQHLQQQIILGSLTVFVVRPVVLTLLVLVFLYFAYPTLFGLHSTPAFGQVLLLNHVSFNNLINILFLLGVLLPVIPVIGAHQGSVTVMQSMLMSAVFFHWMIKAVQIDRAIDYVPGFLMLLQLLVLSYVLFQFSVKVSGVLGERLDRFFTTQGIGMLVEPMSTFFLQGPVILLYTLFLGGQLKA